MSYIRYLGSHPQVHVLQGGRREGGDGGESVDPGGGQREAEGAARRAGVDHRATTRSHRAPHSASERNEEIVILMTVSQPVATCTRFTALPPESKVSPDPDI